MTVLAIDPGNEFSAYVVYRDSDPVNFGKVANQWLMSRIIERVSLQAPGEIAIEMIASYGMPVGREIFETCVWIGRFLQAWGWDRPFSFVYRRDVKLHLCGSSRAKDGNVRAALLDRYGGKATAVGNKKSPGPLYGVSADVWSALAVAVTYSDTQSQSCATTQANAKQCVAP